MLILYIILGIIQGIAEVLPISSSAHLIIFQELFNIKFDNLAVEVILHIASLLSILIYLRKEILDIIIGTFKYITKRENKESFMMVIYMFISMIPITVVTLIIKKLNINIYKLPLISLMLIINSIILFSMKNKYKKENNLNLKSSFKIGLTQSLAIMPGISRSGSCLFGAHISKVESNISKKYAFLLFIPSVIGGFITEISNIKEVITLSNNILIYIFVAFTITIIVTYIALKIFERILKKEKIYMFGYYTMILGLILLIYCFKMGVI